MILTLLIDAHLVCKRAKNHYDPRADSDTASSVAASGGIQDMRDRYRPLHDNQAGNMYFMVSVVGYIFSRSTADYQNLQKTHVVRKHWSLITSWLPGGGLSHELPLFFFAHCISTSSSCFVLLFVTLLSSQLSSVSSVWIWLMSPVAIRVLKFYCSVTQWHYISLYSFCM